MITEEENIVSSRTSHSFADSRLCPLIEAYTPRKIPSDYDYDYSSIFRTMKSRGYMGLYYIYIYIYKYI